MHTGLIGLPSNDSGGMHILLWGNEWKVEAPLLHVVERAVHAPPDDYVSQLVDCGNA